MKPDGTLSLVDLLRRTPLLARKLPSLLSLALQMGTASEGRKRSLGWLLEGAARRHPLATAVKYEGGAYSYAQLNVRSNQTAHLLATRGVGPGDGVAVLMASRPELLEVVAATAKLGAAASMINTRQRKGALLHSLRAVDTRLWVVGVELRPALEEVRDELPPGALDRVLWVGDDLESAAAPGEELRASRAKLPTCNPGTTASVRMGDRAFYVFTSGTTGLPKASIMSHRRWLGAGLMFGQVCLGLGPEDTLYAPLPLYHNQALTLSWAAVVTAGAALAIRRSFSPRAFWDDCRAHGATAMSYIGEVPRYLLSEAQGLRDREHGIRRAVGVGMRPELWRPFQERFGIPEIYEFFSASELNGGFFNLLNLEGTVGWCPVPWALVAFDPDTATPQRGKGGRLTRLGRGETGLLLTKVTPRFPFEGYTDAAASEGKLIRDAFEKGDAWVNTGDLLRHLGFGHLQFVDRLGDTYRWKSENVSTTEVEAVAHQAPGVAACTAYGVKVPGASGRAGMLAVVPSNGGVDLAALLDTLRAELPSYAVPLFVRQVGELEVTGTFKPRKVALREEGYDPARTPDPLWVLSREEGAYVPLDTGLHARLLAGELALG